MRIGKRALALSLALALAVGAAPIYALAGGTGIAELGIIIKDSQKPPRFTLTPQDLTGDFVFTNETGDTLSISPSRFSVMEGGELTAYFAFETGRHPGQGGVLVKSPGDYKLTEYPALPEGYSYGGKLKYDWMTMSYTEIEMPHVIFTAEDLLEDPGYGWTDTIVLLVDNGDAPSAPVADRPSDWAKSEIDRAVGLGLVPDSLNSAFTKNITRAEFCRLAAPLYEKATGSTIQHAGAAFGDTDDADVVKMASLGVVNGVGNNKFDPGGEITREQAATILDRLLDSLGAPLAGSEPAFADSSQISGYAMSSVGKVQAAGIMNGVGNGRFDPQGKY
ncbi:MAG: S-layer homology domain-containing protein, partial [Oscillospiraceae bacterium]|nr:S-layer homology domain-containing protein [Oscillospiraceae bacterium]